MSTTTVSSKYQVVIPQDVRRRLKIQPGQRYQVFEQGGVIQLVPDVPLEDLRGSLRGADVSFTRNPDRAL